MKKLFLLLAAVGLIFTACESSIGLNDGNNGNSGETIPYNEIWYTSTDGNIVTPYATDVFGANIVSNTYENGKGVIVIDAPVTAIGDYAFCECSSLTSVTIPDSVTSIGESAFEYCTSLKRVDISDLSAWCKISYTTNAYGNPLSNGAKLYLDGNEVTDLIIPSDITELKFAAFFGCSSLISVTIPESVTKISKSAFNDCSSLKSTTIGNSVTSIGEYAFEGCTSLTSITIPDSVTSIEYQAFSGCTSLTSVTIGNSVTSIGGRAFYNCTGELIVNCNIPSASSYDYGAFYGSKFTKVTIGDSVTSIGQYAFEGCTSLTTITIPDSVTSIGQYAFEGCTSLTTITIPDSVTSIGRYAFGFCSSLTGVYCKPTTPPSGDSYMFSYYSNGSYYPIGCKIYVPRESVEAYKAASYWSNYASYIEGYDF